MVVSSVYESGTVFRAQGGDWYSDRFELVTEQAPPAASPRLPTDRKARKDTPIYSGVLAYFPDAIADVARLSRIGNEQHNPGEPLHWARDKSTDQADCIIRHQMENGTLDTDGVLHDAKVAWRALAQHQLAIEAIRAAGGVYPPAAV